MCAAQCGPQGGDPLSIHQAQETAAFQNTGALPVGQSAHTETLLTDNTVLLAGGVPQPFNDYARPAQSISVIYNPNLGAFFFRGNMSVARALHTATRLASGQVLIAGGENTGSNSLETAELYNPGPGQFSLTGSMSVPRQGHTATLLNDGTVLVVGGYSRTALTATAEIYNPATGQWRRTAGDLGVARQAHSATLLSNGRVLIVGGYGVGGALASAEIYDPATDRFTPTGNLRQARFLHRSALLGNGRVLVTGGGNFDSLASAELYDPVTGTFSLTGSMAARRQLHSLVVLGNGQVLVAGGSPSFQSQTALITAELYDPIGGQFRPAGNMGTARERHTATLLGGLQAGQVLIAGGHNTSNALTAELYTPTSVTVTVSPPSATVALGGTTTFTATVTGAATTGVTWSASCGSVSPTTTPNSTTPVTFTAPATPGTCTVTAASSDSPSQFATATVSVVNGLATVGHSTHTATLLNNGNVLIAGGTDSPYTDFARPAQARADLYDPARGLVVATGSMNAARVLHTATLLNDGRVLVTGGEQTGSDSLASAETYNPGTGIFSTTGSMASPRQAHTATRLGNGRVLIVGGYNGNNGQVLASAELFDPATGTFSATGSLNVGRQLHTATMLADGRVLILGGSNGIPLASVEIYDPATGTFSVAGNLVTARILHRATRLNDGRVLVTGGSNSTRTGADSLVSAEIYDPATGTSALTANMLAGRQAHTATVLSDGRVVLAGGSDFFQSLSALASVEIFNPSTGTFTAGPALAIARERHSATLLNDGRVFIVGGHNSANALMAEVSTY
ncbi:MAG TPA: kelch repeat-containing protein [Polyangia bacterium]|nr:kelch repeat-containing protein [Polyangia bacterium]